MSTTDHAESFVMRLVKLPVGETEARAVRLVGRKHTPADAQTQAEKLESTIRSAVTRASRNSVREYRIERCINITRSGDFMVVVTVTCIARERKEKAA